jgi:hypothetical protein
MNFDIYLACGLFAIAARTVLHLLFFIPGLLHACVFGFQVPVSEHLTVIFIRIFFYGLGAVLSLHFFYTCHK